MFSKKDKDRFFIELNLIFRKTQKQETIFSIAWEMDEAESIAQYLRTYPVNESLNFKFSTL